MVGSPLPCVRPRRDECGTATDGAAGKRDNLVDIASYARTAAMVAGDECEVIADDAGILGRGGPIPPPADHGGDAQLTAWYGEGVKGNEAGQQRGVNLYRIRRIRKFVEGSGRIVPDPHSTFLSPPETCACALCLLIIRRVWNGDWQWTADNWQLATAMARPAVLARNASAGSNSDSNTGTRDAPSER